MRYIYEATRKKPAKLEIYHDPDSEIFYGFTYRPKPWAQEVEYIQSTAQSALGDLVRPSVPNGFFYGVISGGISDIVEPEWPCKKGETIVDGCVEWMTYTYDLLIRTDAVILSSVWEVSDDNIILLNDVLTDGETAVKVTEVPDTLDAFTLTNRVEIQRAGVTELFDHSMIVKVAQK